MYDGRPQAPLPPHVLAGTTFSEANKPDLQPYLDHAYPLVNTEPAPPTYPPVSNRGVLAAVFAPALIGVFSQVWALWVRDYDLVYSLLLVWPFSGVVACLSGRNERRAWLALGFSGLGLGLFGSMSGAQLLAAMLFYAPCLGLVIIGAPAAVAIIFAVICLRQRRSPAQPRYVTLAGWLSVAMVVGMVVSLVVNVALHNFY